MTYDLSAAPLNTVSVDMRGPYGYPIFDEIDRALSRVDGGDKYIFRTLGRTVTTQSPWVWKRLNNGARYNLLVSGPYEMGLVETVPYAESNLGSGYSDDRNKTSAQGPGCPDTGWRMPSDWE